MVSPGRTGGVVAELPNGEGPGTVLHPFFLAFLSFCPDAGCCEAVLGQTRCLGSPDFGSWSHLHRIKDAVMGQSIS